MLGKATIMRIRYALATCLLVLATGVPTAGPAAAHVTTVAASGAVLKGQVLGEFDPLTGSTVVVYDAATGKALRSAKTSGGDFRISGLPAIAVKVRASAPGWLSQYADKKLTLATADVFTLRAGRTLTLPFDCFDLEPEAVVAGTVTAAGPYSHPVRGAAVSLFDATTGKTLRSTKTGADGTYRIGGLRPRWDVKVRATAAGFLPAFNGGAATLADAPPIPLIYTNPGVITTVDLSMTKRPHGAAVAGQVLGWMDPLSGATVVVYDAATGKALKSTVATSSYFRIDGLPAIPVKIGATAPRWLPSFAKNRTTLATADVFTLHTGQILTLPEDSLDLTPEAVVVGTVTAAGPYGGPVRGATVAALDMSTGKVLTSAKTGPDGTYRIGGLSVVLDGVTVRATAPGFLPAFNGGATTLAGAVPVNLLSGLVQDITVDLSMTRRVPTAVVAGQVLRWSDPYGGEKVVVYDAGTGKALKSTTTDSEGNFRISGLPAIPIKIGASAPGQWLPTYATGKPTLAAADVFTLHAGQTLTLPFDTLDLEPEVVVAGTLTAAAPYGGPVSGATVTVLNAATGSPLKSTKTAADGTYRIGGLTTRWDIKVRATAPGFLPAFDGGATTLAGAPPISLLSNLHGTTAVDLSMSRKPQPTVVSLGLDGQLVSAVR